MWNLDDIEVGDYIKTEVVNKHGDRNLDGAQIGGVVKEIVPSYNMARLDSGWCVYTKDTLLEHRKSNAGRQHLAR